MTAERTKADNGRVRRWIDKHFYEAFIKAEPSARHAPRLPKFFLTLGLVFVVTLLLGWGIFVGLVRLGGSELSFWWPRFDTVDNTKTPIRDMALATVTAASLFAGGFAVVYAYRKQRVDEAAGKRSDEEAFSKRYQDAAEQLGHARAAVRLAGVYSMVRLADDWAEQRQTAVDVLCAYLRMPWDFEVALDGKEGGERQVRRAILRQFEVHLVAGAQPSWTALRFDFSGGHFWNCGLTGAVFDHPVIFYGATFTGETYWDNLEFRSGGTFAKAKFQGRVLMRNLNVSGRSIRFQAGKIDRQSYFELSTTSIASSTEISLENFDVEGVAMFTWANTAHAQGKYYLRLVRVFPDATLALGPGEDPIARAAMHLPYSPSFDAKMVSAAESAEVDLPETVSVTIRANDSFGQAAADTP